MSVAAISPESVTEEVNIKLLLLSRVEATTTTLLSNQMLVFIFSNLQIKFQRINKSSISPSGGQRALKVGGGRCQLQTSQRPQVVKMFEMTITGRLEKVVKNFLPGPVGLAGSSDNSLKSV